MRYPLKVKRHNLSGNTRGQGKRRGGMIMGAMSARVGVSLEIDSQATFSLTDEQAEEVDVMNQWEFNRYRVAREDGLAHDDAAVQAWGGES